MDDEDDDGYPDQDDDDSLIDDRLECPQCGLTDEYCQCGSS